MDLSALLGCAALATDSLLLTILKEAPGIRREIPGWTRQAQTAQNVHPGGRAAARRRGKRTLRESDPPKSKEESHARARLDNCRRHRVSEEGNYIAILRLFLLRLNLQRSGFRPFSCSEPFCNPIKPNDTLPKISSQAYEVQLCLHNRISMNILSEALATPRKMANEPQVENPCSSSTMCCYRLDCFEVVCFDSSDRFSDLSYTVEPDLRE